MKKTLSLTLIVKNEQDYIERVLANAHLFADEIVIVDTGSTDRTKELAQRFTDKIFDFKWCDDFSRARNFGLKKCNSEYIMWLDADDVIGIEDAQRIKNLLETDFPWDLIYFPYHLAFDANGKSIMVENKDRIFKNNGKFKFIYPIHECLVSEESINYAIIRDINVFHKKDHLSNYVPTRNLEILLKNMNKKKYQDNCRMWWHLGREYATHKQHEKSIEAYRKAVSINKEVNSFQKSQQYFELASQLSTINNVNEAIEALGQSIVHFPTRREAYFEVGKIYLNVGRFQEALRMFLICKDIPMRTDIFIPDQTIYDNYTFYDWLSLAYDRVGDYKNALVYVNKALECYPGEKRLLANKDIWEKLLFVNEPSQRIIRGNNSFEVSKNQNFQYFWDDKNWESYTYKIFDAFLDKNHSYIDLGAFIGMTAVYGAQLAKHTYAIEPDPVAMKELKINVDLNKGLENKITLSDVCISDKKGQTILRSNSNGGDSMSSIILKNGCSSFPVNTETLEQFIRKNKIKDCNFIKIDIEGSEVLVLPRAKKILEKMKPTIYLSLHTPWFPNGLKDAEKIKKVLKIYKYLYDINGQMIDPDDIIKNNAFWSLVATDVKWPTLRNGNTVTGSTIASLANPMMTEEKLNNVYHMFNRILDLCVNGDVVELGCYEGKTSVLLQKILDEFACDKSLHVYDSFEGLPEKTDSDGNTPYSRGACMTTKDKLIENFLNYKVKLPEIHVGWFKDTIPAQLPEKISFAHVDGDFYSSIMESLNAIYPRLEPKAIVIIDDYCDPEILNRWNHLPGVKKACDDFFADKPEKVKPLLCGNFAQGFFQKI